MQIYRSTHIPAIHSTVVPPQPSAKVPHTLLQFTRCRLTAIYPYQWDHLRSSASLPVLLLRMPRSSAAASPG